MAFSVELALLLGCWSSTNEDIIMASNSLLPFAEVPLMLSASASVIELPFWMTLCTSVFVPVVMCCLYYGVGFAPIAAERPWLGYLVVAALAMVPRIAGLGNTGYPMYQLIVHLFQLPWHLCACWAYQKADTIWAPICMYAVINLLSALNLILLFHLVV